MFKAIRQKAVVPSRVKKPHLLARFLRRKDGATVVEFSLVLAPFLALLLAILETALVFLAGQLLETAVADSGRLILTGQAQKQKFDATKFRQEVCGRIAALIDCESGLQFDVRTYKSFASIDMSKPIDSDGKLTLGSAYEPGNAGDIVVVRLAYQWPIYVSMFNYNLSDLAGGKRLLLATAAFRNEPF